MVDKILVIVSMSITLVKDYWVVELANLVKAAMCSVRSVLRGVA